MTFCKLRKMMFRQFSIIQLIRKYVPLFSTLLLWQEIEKDSSLPVNCDVSPFFRLIQLVLYTLK